MCTCSPEARGAGLGVGTGGKANSISHPHGTRRSITEQRGKCAPYTDDSSSLPLGEPQGPLLFAKQTIHADPWETRPVLPGRAWPGPLPPSDSLSHLPQWLVGDFQARPWLWMLVVPARRLMPRGAGRASMARGELSVPAVFPAALRSPLPDSFPSF